MCAGSLLGIALASPSSFPVGKVDFMQIGPMTLMEFLKANGDENLMRYLETVESLDPIPYAFFNPLKEKLKMYYVTGGMPEPVLMWTQEHDVDAMQKALFNIISAYERDFAKHPHQNKFPKISMIWKSIPSQLAPTAFGEGNRLFVEFKGALSENYVLQSLKNQFEVEPRYWSQTNPPYEVDFIIQRENEIFPVEVKAETNLSAKSLKKYQELFADKIKLRIRFSLDNLRLDGNLLNIPLFMADHTDRLIGMALSVLQKTQS